MNYTKALELANEMIELDSKFSKSYLTKAYIYVESKEIDLMRQNATKCIEREPNNITAQIILCF